jgi:excisionase family DNA binding protein
MKVVFYWKKTGGGEMEKTTMNVRELSIELGISLPKAYELAKSPGFPAIRVGTRILIPVAAYREWLVISSNKQE